MTTSGRQLAREGDHHPAVLCFSDDSHASGFEDAAKIFANDGVIIGNQNRYFSQGVIRLAKAA